MTKDERIDNLKNKISMELKDPILQLGFEIICKKLVELEKQVKDLEWQLQEVVKDNDIYQAENKRLKTENAELKMALHMYVDWADECGIAWDNFPDMKEKWYKTVEEKGLGWIDGLIFMVTEEAKEQLKKE